jgi:Ferritin-like
MLIIESRHVRDVLGATSAEDLRPKVQTAIEIEHATIPPYLCAYFSLKLGTNEEAAQIIRSVVIEEMLHMTIAANLLIALGGAPAIDTPDFVPRYPGRLPFRLAKGEEISLKPCSIDQINVFMAIEEPEKPIDIPVERKALLADEPQTIGAFYRALAKKIDELGPGIFVGDPSRQVIATRWFPGSELFPIDSPESAKRAIGIIVDQGEGTSTNPFDFGEEPAHFYRFAEIANGRRLVRRHEPPGFAFAGDRVDLDEGGIWDMDDRPMASRYREGSRSRRLAERFNFAYTMLLSALHQAFNGGGVAKIDAAMGVMYELRLLAQQVLATRAAWAPDVEPPAQPKQTGLGFEHWPVDKSAP